MKCTRHGSDFGFVFISSSEGETPVNTRENVDTTA